MRVKLSEHNMDLVMATVRSKGLKIEEVINYLLDNPEEIMSTRGVNVNNQNLQKTCRKSQ